MEILSFLSALAVLVVVGFWFIMRMNRRNSGRDRTHPVYNQNKTARKRHQHTGHQIAHNQSSARIHPSDNLWKSSRVKVNESSWQSSAFVANRILTDAERWSQDKDAPAGSGIPTIEYTPEEPIGRRDSSRKSKAAGKRS